MDEKTARAERLKERVYVTFAALAVTLALRTHAEEAGAALLTFSIVVAGTLLASLLSDVVSHVAVHAALPDRVEVAHLLRVVSGAAASLVLPLVFLVLAAAGVWEAQQALRATTIALVAALAAIGYITARRVRLPWWQRLLVLFGEFGLGALVVLLEFVAHA